MPSVETSAPGRTAFPVRAWLLLVLAASSVPLLLFTCWLAYDYHRLRDATVSQLSNVSRAPNRCKPTICWMRSRRPSWMRRCSARPPG